MGLIDAYGEDMNIALVQSKKDSDSGIKHKELVKECEGKGWNLDVKDDRAHRTNREEKTLMKERKSVVKRNEKPDEMAKEGTRCRWWFGGGSHRLTIKQARMQSLGLMMCKYKNGEIGMDLSQRKKNNCSLSL